MFNDTLPANFTSKDINKDVFKIFIKSIILFLLVLGFGKWVEMQQDYFLGLAMLIILIPPFVFFIYGLKLIVLTIKGLVKSAKAKNSGYLWYFALLAWFVILIVLPYNF